MPTPPQHDALFYSQIFSPNIRLFTQPLTRVLRRSFLLAMLAISPPQRRLCALRLLSARRSERALPSALLAQQASFWVSVPASSAHQASLFSSIHSIGLEYLALSRIVDFPRGKLGELVDMWFA